MVVGTPGFMAPEQVQSNCAIDTSADVFSLGCVLLEYTTRQPAFMGDNLKALLAIEPNTIPLLAAALFSIILSHLLTAKRGPAKLNLRRLEQTTTDVANREARDDLLRRAAYIPDSEPEVRRCFLENIPEHRRTLELARVWLGDK